MLYLWCILPHRLMQIEEFAIHGAIVRKIDGIPKKADIAFNFPNVVCRSGAHHGVIPPTVFIRSANLEFKAFASLLVSFLIAHSSFCSRSGIFASSSNFFLASVFLLKRVDAFRNVLCRVKSENI